MHYNQGHWLKKNGCVSTPIGVARYLRKLLARKAKTLIFDPCIGTGALIEPWRDTDISIMGMDVRDVLETPVARFYQGRFEHCTSWEFPKPDLVLCNPPFCNGGRQMFAEQFLRQIVRIWGRDQPTAMIVPHGFRLNLTAKSERYRWMLFEGPQITSIVSLPHNVFPGVRFHTEILMFNIKGLRPHYWLPDICEAAEANIKKGTR